MGHYDGLGAFARYLCGFFKIANVLRRWYNAGVDHLKNLLAGDVHDHPQALYVSTPGMVLAIGVGATAVTDTHVFLLRKDSQGQRAVAAMDGGHVRQAALLEGCLHARVVLDHVAESVQFRGSKRSLHTRNYVPRLQLSASDIHPGLDRLAFVLQNHIGFAFNGVPLLPGQHRALERFMQHQAWKRPYPASCVRSCAECHAPPSTLSW